MALDIGKLHECSTYVEYDMPTQCAFTVRLTLFQGLYVTNSSRILCGGYYYYHHLHSMEEDTGRG